MRDLELHQLYRAMAWLGEVLPDQAFATPFAPRCTKDLVEERLFEKKRDLFADLILAFFDTTSIYFEGEGADIGQRSNTKDRPDLKQMVVGILLDRDGTPACSELWPGNTADVSTLTPLTGRLQKRFGIGRICVVADRGMIGKDAIKRFQEEDRVHPRGADEKPERGPKRCRKPSRPVPRDPSRRKAQSPQGERGHPPGEAVHRLLQ